MTFVLRDKVQETTTTTGTGPIALAGAVTGYQAFSAVCSIGDTVWYSINHSATAWETGLGTYSSANTLTRTTVFESSNAGSAVNFGTGTKLIFIGMPASKATFLNGAPSTWCGLLPRGYIDGCILSNNGTNALNFTAGVCRDSTNSVDIAVAAMIGKQLDANWAPGAAAGMRNSAAVIANGTYHIYAVATAAGVQDIYAYAGVAGTDADSAASISTMLTALQAESGGSDYVYARRIGSIIRSSGVILARVQRGDEVLYSSPVLDVNVSNPGTAAVTRTLGSIPLGIVANAIINANALPGSSGNLSIYISSLDVTDLAPSTTAVPLSTFRAFGTSVNSVEISCKTNLSGQIRTRQSLSGSSDDFKIATIGYNDFRGKDS